MPTLSSGRIVGIFVESLLDNIEFDQRGELVRLCMDYGPGINTVMDLCSMMDVLYAGSADSPEATATPAGCKVRDVLAGRAGWSSQEIDEFVAWINGNTALQAKLAEDLAALQAQTAAYRQNDGE